MINIDPHAPESLKRQIYQGLRDAILGGHLTPAERLPASRVLAANLGVSRNSVLFAYEQLIAEGYLASRSGAGTFVVDTLSQNRNKRDRNSAVTPTFSHTSDRLSGAVPRTLLARHEAKRLRYDFVYGEPAYADLPLTTWARVLGKCARELTQRQLAYAPHAGLVPLREAVAHYLVRNRGVHCSADQVVIVQGTQEAIDLTTRLLIEQNDTAVVEEPQYRGFARSLMAAGANIHAVPVDEHGLQSSQLSAVNDAKVAFMTPSHQFPLGGVLPLSRRLDILRWAVANNTVIFEDDYDGEFRYDQSPVPSLQSLDQNDSVIYVGTTSKILFPALRIGWMVVPDSLRGKILQLKTLADTWPSSLEQLALARFIQQGHLERHVHRLRRRLAAKRQTLLDTLEEELGSRVKVMGTEAGIHVLLRFPELTPKQIPTLIEQCRALDTGVYPTQPFYRHQVSHAELILGYASLSQTQIRSGVSRLARVLNSVSSG